jgi:hypothetical protein
MSEARAKARAAGAKQTEGRCGYLARTTWMAAVKDGFGEQRCDKRTGCEERRSATADLGNLTLLVGERAGPKFVDAFLKARHGQG